jgi:hypothetical protein
MTFDELNNLKAVAQKYGGLNLGEVDQLIDTAERHLASAEQVRQMREALDSLTDACISGTTEEGYPELVIHHEPFIAAKNALALTPSQAEQQARENAEKAALLEWAFSTASISQDLFAPEFIDECVALIKSQATSPEDMEDILKWGMMALRNRKAAKEAL